MASTAQQRTEIRRYLNAFDFSGLFTDSTIGWDWPDASQKLRVPFGGSFVTLDTVAEKRGVKVLHVPPDADGLIPPSDQRKKLEKAVTPLATEHLLIFTDGKKTRQIWLWTSRLPSKPVSHRELIWEKGKANELLLQKLSSIAFTLDEEDALDITGVVLRLRDSLDRDKVTKKFYDQFKVQKDAFRGFIKGLADGGLLDWYTSLMLNRLMFCYFLQRKGFLDGDPDYLSNRLSRVQDEIGEGQFHSFYKTFLRSLFHDGLGKPKAERAFSPALKKLSGEIPYLNGGIFEEHRIEREHPDLHIPDKAFDHVFTFLDGFDWHLDDRPISSGREINPEILGYVFEKYTNQKEMGAYYTKEDITDYIAKNCIIPFLLDAAVDKLGDASWNLLRDAPDRYIYPAIGHGVSCDYPTGAQLKAPIAVPDYIEKGISTAKPELRKRRARWNESATSELGLLTEIWRETVARRQRCEELQRKLGAGEICAVNDLITLNLNVRQFAQDVVENAGPDLLSALFKAIRKVSVLDPTCGSGAFLFAALNILEPLYRASLDRMRALLGDWDTSGEKHPNFRKDFTAILGQAARHPNENYFIFKSIIVHNLYGVDIMEEAVEICKLRLFLKLAAQLEPGQEIEPLPDIDFNIRAGNTLVGYASREEVRRCMTQFGDGQMRLGVEDELQSYSRFEEAAENVDKAFQLFQQMQDDYGMNPVEFREQKLKLSDRLQTLRNQLDQFLAADYNKRNIASESAFRSWRYSHQPFHWFVEFHGILSRGGFDAVIGNPPYLEYSKVTTYSVRNFRTEACANLYAFTIERGFQLSSVTARDGMIVPISLACSGALESLREILASEKRGLWLSHYSNRPGQLFTGAQNRLTIFISSSVTKEHVSFTTRYHRWNARDGEREHLFGTLAYEPLSLDESLFHGLLVKIGTRQGSRVLSKLACTTTVRQFTSKHGAQQVYWVRVPGYFCQFLLKPPMARPEKGGPAQIRGEVNSITFSRADLRNLAHAWLNSSTYYLFFCAYTDTRHINPSDVAEFPVDFRAVSPERSRRLAELATRLAACAEANTTKRRKSGLLIDSVDTKPCKPVIDEIDTILAKHYGFTEEELDFIINYDIKYRMGLSGGSSDGNGE